MGSDAFVTRMLLSGQVKHQGGQQFLGGKGLAGERFPRAHRVEPHGFTSHPVAGGIATVVQARGNRDSIYALGGANPDLVPTLGLGGTAIYNQHGHIISIVEHDIRLITSGTIHLKGATIILEGNCLLGGPGADRPASARGTVDTAGAADISNPATKVWMI